MGEDMADSENQIELMQQQLELMAAREKVLMAALSEALADADRRLLDDVRSISQEHEARRAHIYSEMQLLADRIGSFPLPAKPVEGVTYKSLELPAVTASKTNKVPDDSEALGEQPKGGDWRKATEKIAQELSLHLNNTKANRAAASS
jgi:hypothetical protein